MAEQAREIFKQVRYNAPYNSITAKEPLDIVNMDLMIMDKIKNKKGNKNYAYGLVIIDIYSRYLWVIPIKKKTGTDVLEGFKKAGIKPRQITSDSGSEFLNSTFQQYLKKIGTEHRTVKIGDHNSLGIVDRVIRTIREKLRVLWEINNNFDWVSHIDKIVSQYNQTEHSTIKNTPYSVIRGKMENEQKITGSKLLRKFPLGTRVRKLLQRNAFEKGGQQWSKEIYTVKGFDHLKVILNDDTPWSPRELQITTLQETKGKNYKEKLNKITKNKTQKQLLKRELGLSPQQVKEIKNKIKQPTTEIRRSSRERKKKNVFDL